MLDSAAQSPLNTKYYTNQDNVFHLAAILSEKIMKNHAYQDGNKRTALLAANMFLKINGYLLQEVPFETEDADGRVNQSIANAHVAVCTNAWTVEQLAQLYQSVARELAVLTADIMEARDAATEA